MPRRRFITMGRLTAAVLAGGLIAYFALSQGTPEASYRGLSASDWLADFLSPRYDNPNPALEAFDKMGTNADPVLVAALAGRENPFVRLYRRYWDRMPAVIQRRWPYPDEPELLRMAAVIVFQHSASNRIIPNLYPMLKKPDSGVRVAVLQAMTNRIPDASQIPLLLLAGNDPDLAVRAEVWHRLSQMGASATNAAPAVLKLCADHNIDVRQEAAWALWKITRQTNAAVPVLESVLSQNQDAGRRHLAAYHLLVMGDSAPFLVTTLINSLTNSQAGDRATVCSFLGQMGPPAAAAIPALRKALQDPEAEVRRRAEVALTKIDPAHAATHAP
jgi:HEAT repeat protein